VAERQCWPLAVGAAGGGGEVLYDKLQALTPKDETPRSLKAEALAIGMGIGQTRWLMYDQTVDPVSVPLLIVLILWLTTIFISFGLLAPANLTVAASYFAAAPAISSAILLILEVYSPYTGLLHISAPPYAQPSRNLADNHSPQCCHAPRSIHGVCLSQGRRKLLDEPNTGERRATQRQSP
jgi:hypothetical protein